MSINQTHLDESVVFFQQIHDLHSNNRDGLDTRPSVLLKPENVQGKKVKDELLQHHPKNVDEFVDLTKKILVEANGYGYGIYISTNPFVKLKTGNKWGTKKPHASPGNTVFWDNDDGVGQDECLRISRDNGYPKITMLVTSSHNNFHGLFSIDSYLSSMDAFTQIQDGFHEKLGTCGGVNLWTQKIRIPGPFHNMKKGKENHRVALVQWNSDRIYPESTFYKAESVSGQDMTPDEYVMGTMDGVLGDETQRIIDAGRVPEGEPRRNTILRMQYDMVARGMSDDEIKDISYKIGRASGLVGQELQDLNRSLKNARAKNPVPAFSEKEVPNFVIQPPSIQTIDEEEVGINIKGLPPWPQAPELGLNHGLCGELTRRTRGRTEAGPTALVMNFITAFGSAVGDGPHFRVEKDYHHCNFFLGIIGVTSHGRKGVVSGISRALMLDVDETWARERQMGGLATGEGLINRIMDPVLKLVRPDPNEENPNPILQYEEVHPGVDDKRLYIVDSEFAQSLKLANKPGNTLGGMLRKAWDSTLLDNPNKNSPQKCEHPHISLVGHATFHELAMAMTEASDVHGGTFNRILWCLTKREVLCPRTGSIEDEAGLQEMIQQALTFAKNVEEVGMTDEAWALWDQEYIRRNTTHEPGLVGAIITRADPQIRRLAMVLALTRLSDTVELQDLEAALDLWNYCEASARRIFSTKVEKRDVDLAKVVDVIKQKPGISQTELRTELGIKQDKDKRYPQLLEAVVATGEVECVPEKTKGRTKNRFYPVHKALPIFRPDNGSVEKKPLITPSFPPNGKKDLETKSGVKPEQNNGFESPKNTDGDLISFFPGGALGSDKPRIQKGDSASGGSHRLGGGK